MAVCTVFLNLMERTSFKRMATVIGTIRPRTILKKAMTTVLRKADIAPGILNRYVKLSKPIHFWCPNRPLAGMNFWKAITMPAIGI